MIARTAVTVVNPTTGARYYILGLASTIYKEAFHDQSLNTPEEQLWALLRLEDEKPVLMDGKTLLDYTEESTDNPRGGGDERRRDRMERGSA